MIQVKTTRHATRDGYGDEILELGKKNQNIVVVDADIGKSCKTVPFSKELPALQSKMQPVWQRDWRPAEKSRLSRPMPCSEA